MENIGNLKDRIKIVKFQFSKFNVDSRTYLKDYFMFFYEQEFISFKLSNKKLDDLLNEFQEKKVHLAIVVDEYGGTSGVISLEDIVEEIIGDINLGFNLSFLNKCDEVERESVREYYQRCFDAELKDSQQVSEVN